MVDVKIQPIDQRIYEIDDQIKRVASEIARHIDAGATFREVDVDIDFLETLFRRRRIMIGEYRKAGGSLKKLYPGRNV